MDANDLERSIETGLRLTRAAIGLGVSLAMVPVRLVLRAISPPAGEERWEPISEPAPAAPAEAAAAPPAPETAAAAPPPASAAAAAAPPPPPGAPRSPAHTDLTSADAARLREAEREAETTPDSPGAELHVEEPWEGYDQMTVTEVRRRLQAVNPTIAAMVRLYEETHKNRKGVLSATAPRPG